MKRKILWMMIVSMGMFGILNAWAAPERMVIKDSAKRTKEHAAKNQIKNIDLRNIEDPEARRAIREILNYLNLQAGN